MGSVTAAAVAASATNGETAVPGWSAVSSASYPAASTRRARAVQDAASRGWA
jgi:hypothetical protein